MLPVRNLWRKKTRIFHFSKVRIRIGPKNSWSGKKRLYLTKSGSAALSPQFVHILSNKQQEPSHSVHLRSRWDLLLLVYSQPFKGLALGDWECASLGFSLLFKIFFCLVCCRFRNCFLVPFLSCLMLWSHAILWRTGTYAFYFDGFGLETF